MTKATYKTIEWTMIVLILLGLVLLFFFTYPEAMLAIFVLSIFSVFVVGFLGAIYTSIHNIMVRRYGDK